MKDWKIIAILVLIATSIQFIPAQVIWSDDSDTDFYTGSNLPICIINSPTSSSWSINGIPSNAMNDCYDENGIDSNGNPQTQCCPSGYTCNQQTGNCDAGSIQPPQPTATSCTDYNRDQCGKYPLSESIKNLIEEQAEIEDDEGNLVRFCHSSDGVYIDEESCLYAECGGCAWSNRENKCIESYLLGDICANPDPTLPGVRVRCETTTNELDNQCNEPGGSIILSWNGRLVYINIDGTSGGAVPSSTLANTYQVQAQHCTANSKEFPCPVKTTLPFFGFFNLIISLGIISVIYFIFRKKIRFI